MVKYELKKVMRGQEQLKGWDDIKCGRVKNERKAMMEQEEEGERRAVVCRVGDRTEETEDGDEDKEKCPNEKNVSKREIKTRER